MLETGCYDPYSRARGGRTLRAPLSPRRAAEHKLVKGVGRPCAVLCCRTPSCVMSGGRGWVKCRPRWVRVYRSSADRVWVECLWETSSRMVDSVKNLGLTGSTGGTYSHHNTHGFDNRVACSSSPPQMTSVHSARRSGGNGEGGLIIRPPCARRPERARTR